MWKCNLNEIRHKNLLILTRFISEFVHWNASLKRGKVVEKYFAPSHCPAIVIFIKANYTLIAFKQQNSVWIDSSCALMTRKFIWKICLNFICKHKQNKTKKKQKFVDHSNIPQFHVGCGLIIIFLCSYYKIRFDQLQINCSIGKMEVHYSRKRKIINGLYQSALFIVSWSS